MDSEIRVGSDGLPYKIESYAYVPWEMHGMRGCLLPEVTKMPSGRPLPWAAKYVLECGRCPVHEVAAGKHAFQTHYIHYFISLARVRTDNDWSRHEL